MGFVYKAYIFMGKSLSGNLSHSSLRGFLATEIGSLTSLQELILNENLFFGTIPSQISMLKNLTLLDLSTNQLVGPILAEIGGLYSVNKINFHSNGLTGTVPPELGNLVNLVELRLYKNKLQGSIPRTSNLNFTSDILWCGCLFCCSTESWALCNLWDRSFLGGQAILPLTHNVENENGYLHHHATPHIIHMDIKTTIVLLDSDFQVGVADFGFAKLIPDGATNLFYFICMLWQTLAI